MAGTAVTKLEFSNCSFSTLECAAILAESLSRNTSVSQIEVAAPLDQVLYSALAAAIPLNSTLRDLYFGQNHSVVGRQNDVSPVLLALNKNTGLKNVSLDGFGLIIDESLCTAMQNGLGTNETLESLTFTSIRSCENTATLWYRAFSFLRTNKALKSLVVDVSHGVSCISAFRIGIVAMLQENASLESLTISCGFRVEIQAEEYLVLLTAIQRNTTLKTLFTCHSGKLRMTDDESKQMTALVKKNYALEMEKVPGIGLLRDVGAILRLNKAGRRYLI
jgi:hypothetical protein